MNVSMEEQTRKMVNETKIKNERAKKSFLKLGWILFLLLLAAIIGAVYLPKLVHASPIWPLNKSQTCEMFNYTGIICDSYWCNNFISNNSQNCTYDITLSICSCMQVINITNTTIITNTTNSSSVNCSNTNITFNDWNIYCNKTINCSDTNISIADFNLKCQNNTNLTYLNDSRYVTVEDFNNWSFQFRNSVSDNIQNLSYLVNQGSSDPIQVNQIDWTMVTVIVIAVCILIGFLSYTGLKRKPKAEVSQFRRAFDNSAFFKIDNKKEIKEEKKPESKSESLEE